MYLDSFPCSQKATKFMDFFKRIKEPVWGLNNKACQGMDLDDESQLGAE